MHQGPVRNDTLGRDGSLGLLIASGMFCGAYRAVLSSFYLGCGRLTLKLVGAFFQQIGKPFQRGDEIGIGCRLF